MSMSAGIYEIVPLDFIEQSCMEGKANKTADKFLKQTFLTVPMDEELFEIIRIALVTNNILRACLNKVLLIANIKKPLLKLCSSV